MRLFDVFRIRKMKEFLENNKERIMPQIDSDAMSNAMANLDLNQMQPSLQLSPLINSDRTTQLTFNPYPLTGLPELVRYCSKIYRHTPIMYSTGKHYVFEGGQEPLDLIYVYKNEGKPCEGIPTHWHYISFGLSDIRNYYLTLLLDKCMMSHSELSKSSPLPEHFPRNQDPDSEKLSGFGFELSFRLKCEPVIKLGQTPPDWPREMMQSIARYVFETNFPLTEGDHFSWNKDLLVGSCIKHVLITEDSQLKEVKISSGKVQFMQLVGVTQDELDAARKGSSKGIMNIMKERIETGHRWLVTDMQRSKSIFDLDEEIVDRVSSQFKQASDFLSVCKNHLNSSTKPNWFKEGTYSSSYENSTNTTSSIETSSNSIVHSGHHNVDNDDLYLVEPVDEDDNENSKVLENDCHDSVDVIYLKEIYLLFDLELAKMLPVVLEHRLARGQHFIIMSLNGDLNTILVPENCSSFDSSVTKHKPYVEYVREDSRFVEILIDLELNKIILTKLNEEILNLKINKLSKTYSWTMKNFHLTIIDKISNL